MKRIIAPLSLIRILAILSGSLSWATHAEDGPVIGGAGWIQIGRIGHSSDPDFGKDFKGSGIYSSGAQIEAKTSLSASSEAVAGVGVAWGHTLASGIANNGGYAPSYFAPYVAQAHFTYNFIKRDDDALFFRGGLFPYDYNPEVENLGLYLLRGPVYPGLLISGFELKHVLPVAALLGGQLRWRNGNFDQDLLLISDNENFPYFDLSTAYIANYRLGNTLRIGAGVNFYHWYAITDSLTNGKWDPVYSIYVDTTNPARPDTTVFGFAGTKIMANASFDPKHLFGSPEAFGPEDLKIYAEVAVLGLDNGPAYKAVYGDLKSRMPVMVGFNIPAFRLLDRLALEIEHYGSKTKDDFSGFNHTAGSHPNPLPPKDPITKQFIPATKDDFKWSLYGSRIVGGHTKISFQIANDHFRPLVYTGDGDNSAPGSQALMTTAKDWYTMVKLAYFF